MFRLFKHYVPHAVVWLALLEFAALFASANAAWALYAHIAGFDAGDFGDRWLPLTTFAVANSLAMMATGMYGAEALRSMKFATARLLAAVSLGVIFLSVVGFLLPTATLWRVNSFYAMGLAIAALFLIRLALTQSAGADAFKRRILVLGAGARAARLRALAEAPGSGIDVVGFVAMTGNERTIAEAVPREAIANLSDHVVALRAGEVVLAMEERRNALPLADLLRVKTTGVHVNDIASFIERETGRVDLATTNPSVLIFSDGFSAGQRISKVGKRLFDIVASLIVLVIGLPLALIAALAVKLDSKGPVLYRQPRVGLFGEPYNILKIRSMRTDAEAAGKAVWAAENDPRITRVGHIIRKLRIDELPQLWCVLKGEMSFVGPRPERPSFVDELERQLPYYAERHMVKPGLTGWAQINYPYGASVEDARVKLEYDLYYAKNYSPFLDLLILLQTVRVVLWPEGAR
ncbi:MULTISPECIES: TIGR03013 family XrtA/PEP-CTERM system glycosyltransferase [Sphingopyxis]|jgi:sugar transferase (PEP-CTERM system associated)|uniref:Sugar transferase, PEP-CTERM system associated/exopolysaccharide biosynthesis polyprenyl glycosylphosphotransferase n=1 Tax=Sphingopyxis terrae subsp. ummariensis TaxID=429001 RepID=A0A1Y6FUV6_9SPHN|nr:MULTISPECIES: TIGR03013 family XrtA/PEP-CTERM system glycosyltransferase [Sphingopyxis]ENY81265.1 undecaprenyl-phosphate galactosephosphotransferase [Sphingopyxis sp. MC1]MBU7589194.1 TIGR03013 family PEP-CTERM/XrtA system glycosyltransferase [Sphingopyxis terrae]MDX8358106.1 TIGR03013 family PEP-CTERM/XrtA system glycosyltransferase [Sphingopyxis terrae]PCF90820.1 sugar transferase [Sphingopyxis terrae subsp. ummariensis]SMQ79029.1 sugar transferase, PEP-CTERM system associated/exopolysacc